MKKLFFLFSLQLIIGMFCLTGCDIRESEIIDINGMKITRGLINRITAEAGETYELFIRYNWIQDPAGTAQGQRTDTIRNGVVYKGLLEDHALNIYELYKSRLKANNKYLFISSPKFTRSGNMAYDLVILEANNQFQAMKILNTNGLREGIGHDRIFDFLVQLHQSNPVEIFLIDENSLGLRLKNEADQNTLDEVEKLCPKFEYFQRSLKLIWDK